MWVGMFESVVMLVFDILKFILQMLDLTKP